jgi:hypothetical protein
MIPAAAKTAILLAVGAVQAGKNQPMSLGHFLYRAVDNSGDNRCPRMRTWPPLKVVQR